MPPLEIDEPGRRKRTVPAKRYYSVTTQSGTAMDGLGKKEGGTLDVTVTPGRNTKIVVDGVEIASEEVTQSSFLHLDIPKGKSVSVDKVKFKGK